MSRHEPEQERTTPGGLPPLQLGVIGLGPNWRRRYKPALRALRDRFVVRTVCDQVQRHAEKEARELDCTAAAGPTEFLEDDRLDALLMPDVQWYGLWPLELACRAGKPVLCGPSLEVEDARADDLLRQVRECLLPVVAGLALRQGAATARLHGLLADELGPPRLLLCDVIQLKHRPSLPAGPAADHLLGPEGAALADWLAQFLGDAEPISALTARAPDFVSVCLDFDAGRAVQINRLSAPAAHSGVRLRILAERGRATLRLPNRLSWTAPEGEHRLKLRTGPTGVQTLLLSFEQGVRTGQAVRPDLADAHRVLRWLRLARQSLTEGRRVSACP
jgi:predicted dehydrogenase